MVDSRISNAPFFIFNTGIYLFNESLLLLKNSDELENNDTSRAASIYSIATGGVGKCIMRVTQGFIQILNQHVKMPACIQQRAEFYLSIHLPFNLSISG